MGSKLPIIVFIVLLASGLLMRYYGLRGVSTGLIICAVLTLITMGLSYLERRGP